MKAGVYVSPGKLGVKEVPDPVLNPGEVLVRVKAAGICGSDLHSYRDPSRFSGTADRVAGHEFAGDIVAVGEGVDKARIGERVGVEPLLGCGECTWCAMGDYHLCPQLAHIGGAWSGGFAELSKAPAQKAYRLPDGISCEAGAILDCIACGVHAMRRTAATMGESVVVLGGGAIGLSVLECAKWAGAGFVALSDPMGKAREIADQLGADLTIDPSDGDPGEKVLAATGGRGADVVIEAVGGRAPTLKQAVGMVRSGGRLGYLGSFQVPQELEMGKLLRREITIIPIWSYATWGPATEYQLALHGLAQGRVVVGPMVTHRFPLHQIDEAFQAAANKDTSGAVKVIVNP
jgi:threonine dehydrogenase-like Zn-dependent dehydrogenase